MTTTARKRVRLNRIAANVGAAAIIGLSGLSLGGVVVAQQPTAPKYNADHQLLLPKGFETWVFVGSNLGLTYNTELKEMTAAEVELADTPKFNNIYIDPEAYAHFLRTGKFPEPTILVMEVFAKAEKKPKDVLKDGSYNGQRVGLRVAVKNSARPDGVKTPWAYYDFTEKVVERAPAKPDNACETCHRQHASKDNVWVQFYPHLRDANK